MRMDLLPLTEFSRKNLEGIVKNGEMRITRGTQKK